MTSNRIQKQAIRARMESTGESYSIAARALALEPLAVGPLSGAFGGGLRAGQLHLVASRPGGGGTSLMASVAVALITAGKTVLCINPELAERELQDSFARAAVRGGEIITRRFESEAASRRLCISPATSLHELRRELTSGRTPDVLLVDSFELFNECFRPEVPLQEAYAAGAELLRGLAQEFSVPVVVSAKVDREAVEGPVTTMRLRASELVEAAGTVTAVERGNGGFGARLLKNRFGSTEGTVTF